MQLPLQENDMVVVDQPTKEDILFGRHSQSLNHEGNKRFRSIVSKFGESYHSTSGRNEKVAIVAMIISEVRENGARFLKRDRRTHQWYEVDRKAVIDKVGHAIRDKQLIAHRNLRLRTGQKEKIIPKKRTAPKKQTQTDVKRRESRPTSKKNPNRVSPIPPSLPRAEKQDPMTPKTVPVSDSLENALLLGMEKDPTDVDLALIRRLRREAEDAARKYAAAEDLYKSIQKQKEMEGEIARIRQHRSLLMSTIAAADPASHLQQAPSQDVTKGVP